VSLRDWLAVLRRKRETPVINTQWGPVTESARHQAALNLRDDPDRRAAVEDIIIAELGGDRERGLKEARRRYPEAYQ